MKKKICQSALSDTKKKEKQDSDIGGPMALVGLWP